MFNRRARSVFVAVALFHENDDTINQLAYNVSAKTVNIMDAVLPKNKIAQKSEFVMNDLINVTQVGKSRKRHRQVGNYALTSPPAPRADLIVFFCEILGQ